MTTHAEPMIQTNQPQQSTPGTIRQERWTIAGVYLFLLLFSIFILIPFVWPFLSAFTDKPENVSASTSIGRSALRGITSGHDLWAWPSLYINAQFAGHRLQRRAPGADHLFNGRLRRSRARFRWKRPLMFGILLVQIIPGTATVLPFYLIMRELHLLNSLLGVVLGMTAGAIPFMLWVMKGFIDTVPIELEEAAFLDGASRFQALTRVVFPLALPGVGGVDSGFQRRGVPFSCR
ncbi:MAG: ABC transporter permease subunit [Caldilineaceae bacterium]